MVERGKPFPDLFLHAASDMGVAPGHCLVVEDSPAGIMAAKEAGMRVLAFTGGSHAGEGALREAIESLEPDLVFGDMRQLARPAVPVEHESPLMAEFVCAVDVGTGSARAGIVDRAGRMLGRAEHPIAMHRSAAGHAEHDSEDIWASVCAAVRAARERAGVSADDVAGISFDATCSLVVRGRDGGNSLSRLKQFQEKWIPVFRPEFSKQKVRAAILAGTRSCGSTIARWPRPTNAPPRAIACSTISAA